MMAAKAFVFRFDDVEVREREFSLIKAGQALTVEPKAFRVLLILLKNPQKLFPKEELLNAVWGDVAVSEGSLTRCIFLLRNALGDDTRNSRYIETVATVGYRWVCKVDASEDSSGETETSEEPNVSTGDGKRKESRKRYWVWAVTGSSVLALTLDVLWSVQRPLTPPRITGYNQITHDGHRKKLAGTDGSRLYFGQSYESNLFFTQRGGDFDSPTSISQVAISGGEIGQISVPVPNPELADVTHDGLNMLIFDDPFGDAAANPLWNVRTLGGPVRRLGKAVDAAFSPDGNEVAYSTPGGDILLTRTDGTGDRKLASIGGRVFGIAWSPDGSTIRFNKDNAIWAMSANGSNPHPLFPGRRAFFDCCGRWTPDGKLFVFNYVPQGIFERSEIWALGEERGLLRRHPEEPVQLAGGPTRWGRPIPGKDGRTIFAEGLNPRGELSRYDAKAKQFQPFLDGISGQGATFSKDGKYVAYVSFPESILWKANRDGRNPVQLTDHSMWAFLPRWSPDGKEIAFVAWSPTIGNQGIYFVSAEGGTPPKLIPEISEPQNFPYWSPDGHKVVFNALRDQHDLEDIRILDLDTRKVSTIPGSDGLHAPRWSPDGRYLSATGDDGSHLMIFDFQTQRWSELPQKGIVDSPEWSRDGRFIYFRRATGDKGVFRISIKGGAAEKVVDLKDWHDAGWYGRWMALDPTDAPLLLRDIGSDDLYALTLDRK